MLSVRKQDPLFINFTPTTAEEAVDRFLRCKKRGLRAFMIPECLIECAKGLPEDEAVKFENWLINPSQEEPEENVLVRINTNEQNQAIFEKCAQRCEKMIAAAAENPINRLMNEQEDEKVPEEPL